MRFLKKGEKKYHSIVESYQVVGSWKEMWGLFRCIYMDEHIVIHNLKFVNGNGCSIWINM